MTRVRTTMTSTILAAAFVAGLSGAALAGDNQRNQGPTASNTMTAGQDNGTSNNLSTWAAAYALQVYQKCKDNILPECPTAE